VSFIVDMNLGPGWVDLLLRQGHTAVHWSSVGDPRATDESIVAWARKRGAVVLTADLDFSAILAMTGASGPSVVLLRVQDSFSHAVRELVCAQLAAHAAELSAGAIVTIDLAAARVRVLPMQGR
jgi:predicted nuclease of predicted toxin-antitoxin system